MTDIYAGVVYGDAHAPEHDPRAVRVMCKVIDIVRPNVLIDIGDAGEMASINGWNRSRPRLKENERLVKDLKAMYGLSDVIASHTKRGCKKIKMIGNHEHWVETYLDYHPELEGLEGINIPDTYEGMGWTVVPWGEFHQEGKLHFHHGDRKGYQTKWHSGQWAMMGRSVVYGHRHDVQTFTQETLQSGGRTDKHRAWSIGCMRKLAPDWMHNRKNNWQQGFGIFYVRSNGMFSFYPVDITNGTAIWNGKMIKG